jgi:hypothetical protein
VSALSPPHRITYFGVLLRPMTSPTFLHILSSWSPSVLPSSSVSVDPTWRCRLELASLLIYITRETVNSFAFAEVRPDPPLPTSRFSWCARSPLQRNDPCVKIIAHYLNRGAMLTYLGSDLDNHERLPLSIYLPSEWIMARDQVRTLIILILSQVTDTGSENSTT